MSLRYLYKMLFTHFSKEMKSVTKIWDQIDEVKRILSKPEFKRFSYVWQFIEEINWTQLNNLNEKAHDSTQKKRNFKGLPNVNEFIQLNLLFYKDQNSVDVEFEKIKTYEDAYISVFEQK